MSAPSERIKIRETLWYNQLPETHLDNLQVHKNTDFMLNPFAESDRNHQTNNDIFDPIFSEIEHQSVLKMKIHAINQSDLDYSVNVAHYRASQSVGSSHDSVISDHIVSDHSVVFDPMKTTSENMR